MRSIQQRALEACRAAAETGARIMECDEMLKRKP